jgi:hypothetical protein
MAVRAVTHDERRTDASGSWPDDGADGASTSGWSAPVVQTLPLTSGPSTTDASAPVATTDR